MYKRYIGGSSGTVEKWKDRKNTGIADMNVEKLREVGQKLGYDGEELNEFVEEVSLPAGRRMSGGRRKGGTAPT